MKKIVLLKYGHERFWHDIVLYLRNINAKLVLLDKETDTKDILFLKPDMLIKGGTPPIHRRRPVNFRTLS